MNEKKLCQLRLRSIKVNVPKLYMSGISDFVLNGLEIIFKSFPVHFSHHNNSAGNSKSFTFRLKVLWQVPEIYRSSTPLCEKKIKGKSSSSETLREFESDLDRRKLMT